MPNYLFLSQLNENHIPSKTTRDSFHDIFCHFCQRFRQQSHDTFHPMIMCHLNPRQNKCKYLMNEYGCKYEYQSQIHWLSFNSWSWFFNSEHEHYWKQIKVSYTQRMTQTEIYIAKTYFILVSQIQKHNLFVH